MRGRSGQVAIYLALVLVAICLLAVMNAGVFLSVRTKNRTMNAGDAAALAVAKYQGELLNRMGAYNVDHLQAALRNETNECLRIMREQARVCFLGPLDGIRIGNEMAKANGISRPDEEAQAILLQHANDIVTDYPNDPEQFPPPWTQDGDHEENAWVEYARCLRGQVQGGLYASPDNIDFVDAAGGHLLLNFQFYNAVAGENWCWFHFNAPGLLGSYDDHRSWGPLPSADDETRRHRCVNSEVYSLHLRARAGSAVQLLGRDLVKRLLDDCSDEDIDRSELLSDPAQVWYFYDDELWRTWWEMDPNGEWDMPVCGTVKPQYNVRGCAACCRVVSDPIPDLLGSEDPRIALDNPDAPDYVGEKMRNLGEEGAPARQPNRRTARRLSWTAAAKPFGEDDGADVVTGGNGLVLPRFSDVRLVPWDSVGGRDTERPNMDMLPHIRNHLPGYLMHGKGMLAADCHYCRQLARWEIPSFRQAGERWLRYNSRSCIRSSGGGSRRGGTPHGH